jgi:hypothetical protein
MISFSKEKEDNILNLTYLNINKKEYDLKKKWIFKIFENKVF